MTRDVLASRKQVRELVVVQLKLNSVRNDLGYARTAIRPGPSG